MSTLTWYPVYTSADQFGPSLVVSAVGGNDEFSFHWFIKHDWSKRES